MCWAKRKTKQKRRKNNDQLIKEGEDEIRKKWSLGHIPSWANDVLTGILIIFRRSAIKVRKATLDEVRERLVQNTGLLCSCKEVKHMGLIYSEECPTHVFILATLETNNKGDL